MNNRAIYGKDPLANRPEHTPEPPSFYQDARDALLKALVE